MLIIVYNSVCFLFFFTIFIFEYSCMFFTINSFLNDDALLDAPSSVIFDMLHYNIWLLYIHNCIVYGLLFLVYCSWNILVYGLPSKFLIVP